MKKERKFLFFFFVIHLFEKKYEEFFEISKRLKFHIVRFLRFKFLIPFINVFLVALARVMTNFQEKNLNIQICLRKNYFYFQYQ